MQLRDYQLVGKQKIEQAWADGARNVCYRLPTGGGKTVLFSSILQQEPGASVAIAHRQELVGQIAMALAKNGVRHRIIGPQKVIKMCINMQMMELGTHFYNHNAPCAVAGVDTLVRRHDALRHWLHQVQLWVMDEAHHLLTDNKWGKASQMFPNARGLGVTATPVRADGKGLGRHADGLLDALVEGPEMRELINRGYLTDYRIFAPPSDIDLSSEQVGSTGDWSSQQLKRAAKRSHIVGDVVEHYRRFADGKLGVTFATDVETAGDIKNQFVAMGVPAAIVSAKTPDRDRYEIIQRFRRREILQLVNVDLFGEGFDLPAIEVVSMARPTQSYGLYCQQFGRSLRPMEGKSHAIIIDHVGNVVRHGLPDKPRIWSLDAREKRPRMQKPDDDIPLRYCVECTAPYEKIHKVCPWCGAKHVPQGRSKPEYVDGDLFELDPNVLKEMRGERDWVDADPAYVGDLLRRKGAPQAAVNGAIKNQRVRQQYQRALRESIRWYAIHHQEIGRDESQIYRAFYLQFGIDVMSAQTLGKQDALELANRINEYLGRCK